MKKYQRACHRRRQGKLVGEWLEALFRLLDRQEVVVMLWQTSHVGSPMNEWADLQAAQYGGAHGSAAVPVVRLPTESASMLFTMPRRSHHEWAAPLACDVVSRRLRGASDESQYHSEFDIPVLKLPDAVQRTCEAVLAQRCQMGDAKRRLGVTRLQELSAGTCPFGCKGNGGAPTAFTWFHVQFECRKCEIVAARGAWIAQCDSSGESMEVEGVPHHQVATVRALAAKGMPRTRGGAGRVNTKVSALTERRARRLVGGLVEALGDPHKDANKAVRAAISKMVCAGVAVQHEAQKLTADMEKSAREAAIGMARVRKLAQRWLRVTREAGPARVALLKATVAASQVAADEVVRAARAGEVTIEMAEAQLERITTTGDTEAIQSGTCVALGIKVARKQARRLGGTAY